MDSPVDIGVIPFIIMLDGFDNRQRLLGGGGAIQIHQRMAVDFLVQNGKKLADLLGIHCSSFLSTSRCSWSSILAIGISDTTGARKP
ncbi:hypothetical protein D3C75_989120 [compost metagenome]